MTRRPLFDSSILAKKKKSSHKITRLSCGMSIDWYDGHRKGSLDLDEISCRLQDSFKAQEIIQEVVPLFLATLGLIKTQELILVCKRKKFRRYLSHGKEGRKSRSGTKLDDREER